MPERQRRGVEGQVRKIAFITSGNSIGSDGANWVPGIPGKHSCYGPEPIAPTEFETDGTEQVAAPESIAGENALGSDGL